MLFEIEKIQQQRVKKLWTKNLLVTETIFTLLALMMYWPVIGMCQVHEKLNWAQLNLTRVQEQVGNCFILLTDHYEIYIYK